MAPHYDVAIVGLGIVGSAILAKLSDSRRVVGIDRYTPPHTFGSSHGENRIVRGAPGEGRVYAQMARRAFTLFGDIERHTGRALLAKTGGIDSSTSPSTWAADVRAICAEEDVPFEAIEGSAFNARYPHFNLPRIADVVVQPAYGHIAAEQSWLTFLDVGRDNGADVQFGRKIVAIEFGEPNIVVFEDGTRLTAGSVVLATGSWLNELLDFRLRLRVERRVLAWYPVERRLGLLLPFCFVDGPSNGFWYGMPSLDEYSLKIGAHFHFSENTDPDAVPPVNQADLALLGGFIKDNTNGLSSEPIRTATCKYTLTEGGDFIIGRHPHHANVLIFSCCSGHGFKYAPVYGEIAESMLDERRYGIDLSSFDLVPHIESSAGPVHAQRSSD